MAFPAAHWRDSKRIQRALFGVYYEEDIFEKYCQCQPRIMRAFWWRLDPQAVQRNLIFIHVPRAAGTSVAHALHGPRNTLHYSIRYYKTVHPAFYERADSFAILRDPFERFASAYFFVRAGGTASCRLSDVFVDQTRTLRSVDDYLAFLEDRDVFSLDFVMRPQSWFVCDLQSRAVLVKRLFQLGSDTPALAAFLQRQGVNDLPRLNSGSRLPLHLTARQRARIETLYADDFTLIENLAAARAMDAERFARVAAE